MPTSKRRETREEREGRRDTPVPDWESEKVATLAYITPDAPTGWPEYAILCMILRTTLDVNQKHVKLRAVSLPNLSYLFIHLLHVIASVQLSSSSKAPLLGHISMLQ